MRFIVGAATDVGRVREGNEDAYLVDSGHTLYAVADGMGGHRAGEVASATALEALRSAVVAGNAIDEAVHAANTAVFEKSVRDDSLRGMGTTIVAAVPGESGLLLAHVGDSRAYLHRAGELEQVTVDHSLVEELVREGRITAAQAAVHPQRSIITRALGVGPDVDVDVIPVALENGDRVLICSDGLSSMIHADEIARVLATVPDPTAAANALVDSANRAGGEDNITALVLDVVDDPANRAEPSPVESASAGLGESTRSAPNGASDRSRTRATTTDVDTSARPDASHDSAIAPARSRTAVVAPRAIPPYAPPRSSVRSGPRSSAGPSVLRAPSSTHSDVDEPAQPSEAPAGPRRARTAAYVLARVLWFAVPIALIAGIAFGATWWYANRTYFVQAGTGEVLVYRGLPGGLLGWEPRVVARTGLPTADLTPADRDRVRHATEFSSRSAADAFVRDLRRHAASAAGAGSGSVEPSTSTTSPGTAATTGSISSVSPSGTAP